MLFDNEETHPAYINGAITAFHEIMSNNKKDMLENINRANRGELFVLHFLAERDAAVLPSEMSAALHASTARISAVLGVLEKKGQIERNIDKNNRRNILVTVTEAGRERAETEFREMQNGMASVFTEMGEADTSEFIRLMKKFFTLSQKYMSEQEGSINA